MPLFSDQRLVVIWMPSRMDKRLGSSIQSIQMVLGEVESGHLNKCHFKQIVEYILTKYELYFQNESWYLNKILPYDIATLEKSWMFHILLKSQVGDKVIATLLQTISEILLRYPY